MGRDIRYQGAILHDHHNLLLRFREQDTGHTYWLFPGGGIEPGETAEVCVRREMREETHLDVAVERLLFDDAIPQPHLYQRRQTYLCRIVCGEAQPGHEPELAAREGYGILEVKWFDLRAPEGWDELLKTNAIAHPQMLRLCAHLGYA
jgi:8-oxo-dGTP diphosphatase